MTRRMYETNDRPLDEESRLTLQLIEHATGRPPPTQPFPAIITGKMLPKPSWSPRPYPNSRPEVAPEGGGVGGPVADTPPECDEAIGGFLDPDNLPDTDLPDGVWPVRYRWRSLWTNLSSEVLCGWLRRIHANSPDEFLIWRDAFTAINTAHLTQTTAMDYPYLHNKTYVIMCLGDVSQIGSQSQKLGFFFHHMTDAGAAIRCPAPPPPIELTCCELLGGPPPGFSCNCMLYADCLAIGGIPVGRGPTCNQSNCSTFCNP